MHIALGSRIDCAGHKGTVRYVGDVAGTSGTWVGIDWDEPKRGKHDGTVKGIRYFHAREPSSGSFVRPENLTTGRGLIAEMSRRYTENDGSENTEHHFQGKVSEFIGFERIRAKQIDIYKLEIIVLTQMCVSHIEKGVPRMFERCVELNLSGNLITRWSDVIEILQHFPALQLLIVWDNRLEPLRAEEADPSRVKAPVKRLVLNNCEITDETADLIPVLFPRLEELHMASNRVSTFRPPKDCRLKELHIQENDIQDFSRLHALKDLPRLQLLSVFNCGFNSIVLATEVGFAELNTLQINDNHFTEWGTINELARLPSLRKLSIKGLMPGERGMSVREMTIAKLPQLVDLDRCDISPIERRSSEVLFLNRFGHEPIPEVHRNDIKRLVAQYGPPDPVNVEKFRSKELKFLNLTLEYDGQAQQRNISLVLPIRSLVGMGSRLFGFAPDEVHVELRRQNYPVESIDRTRTNLLQQFDLDNGDVIAFLRD